MSPSSKLNARCINAWLTLYQFFLKLWSYQSHAFSLSWLYMNSQVSHEGLKHKKKKYKSQKCCRKKKMRKHVISDLGKVSYLVCGYNSQFLTCKWKCLHRYRFSSHKLIIGDRIIILHRSLKSFRPLPFHFLSRRGQSGYMIQKQSPFSPRK